MQAILHKDAPAIVGDTWRQLESLLDLVKLRRIDLLAKGFGAGYVLVDRLLGHSGCGCSFGRK